MERQLLGTLLLLLLPPLTLASATSGQANQHKSPTTSPVTSHNSVLQTSSTEAGTTVATTGVNTTLATASTVMTTVGRPTCVTALMADNQKESITTSPSTAVITTRQDMAPSATRMSSTSKDQIGTTQSTPTQPMKAANTMGRGITDKDIKPETKATNITSTLIPTAGKNTNLSTTKMASDMVTGTIKAIPTASTTVATTEKDLTKPTATINSLLQDPEGTSPTSSTATAAVASTAKAAESLMVTMSKTTGGTSAGISPHSMGTTTHAGTNGPMKTIISETNPIPVTLTTISTTRKNTVPLNTQKNSILEATHGTPMISMTVTEAPKVTADVTTTDAGTVSNMKTVSETKAMTEAPTTDTLKDTISSVATMSSRSESQEETTPHPPTGSLKLTARTDTTHEAPRTTTTTLPTALGASSSGINTSPLTSGAGSSLPLMSKPCASDEYPSPTLERGCMCNSSLYARPEVNNVTVALSCGSWGMEVSLSQCFLETHGWVQGDALFPGCSGVSKIVRGWRAITFVVKRNESAFGLRLSTNTSHALYSLNTRLPPAPPGSKLSSGSIDINFSCAYPLVVNVSQQVPPKVANSLPTNIHVTSTRDSIITLSIFTDAQYSSLIVDKPVAFRTPLYVALEATNTDPEQFVLVVNAFFASTNASGALAPETTYYFVKHSCPVSERLQTSINGVSLKVKLAFQPFRFFASDVLYYHSHVTLCDKQGNSSCQPTCTRTSQKQRNLEHQNEDKSGWLTYGPVQFQGSDPSNNRAPAGPMRIWLTFLLLVVMSQMLA